MLQSSYNHIIIYLLACVQQYYTMMYKVQKQKYCRPNLVIEIQDFQKKIDEFNEKHTKNQVAIKPLRSAKNIYELKKFNFEDKNIQNINHSLKLQKLHKLQQEKQNLIESLQILKQSAVCAIAEKEDQLQKLRGKDALNNEQKLEIYELELNISRKLRDQLQEECYKLDKQMRNQKQKYIMELQQKEMFIQELHNQILQIRRGLEVLQHNDLIKTKKIKILQEENSKLSVELELVSMDNSIRERYEGVSQNWQSQEAFGVHKRPGSSVIQDRNILSMLESEHFFHSEEDKTFMSQKLHEINMNHRQELLQIRTHYEQQISALRQIYERQLNLPTEQNERSSSMRKRSKSKSLSNSSSIKSLKSQNQQHRKGSQQEAFRLNLKSMNTIIESVEQFMDTERTKIHILQKEIKMQNLSECPSVQERMVNNYSDNQSQFTTKYFDSTFRFLKKNKSSEHIQHPYFDTNETKTILKIKKEKDEVIQENLVTQIEQNQHKQGNIWQKSYLFVSGIVSGVALSSITGYFFRKT